MVNKVVLVGRLGRDPEMRYTGAGTAVANFSVATDERWNTRDGESQNRTEWHNIVVWSKLAEICNQYLTKGKLVYIEGRLQTRDWEDRDGNKRRTTEIVATEMKMLGARNEGPPRENDPLQRGEESDEGAKGSGEATGPMDVASGEATGPMDVGITDDDIPF